MKDKPSNYKPNCNQCGIGCCMGWTYQYDENNQKSRKYIPNKACNPPKPKSGYNPKKNMNSCYNINTCNKQYTDGNQIWTNLPSWYLSS